MKKKVAKSILSWLLVFSMVIPSLSYVINTQAADGDATITVNTLSKEIDTYSVTDAKALIGDQAPTCEYEGYLFSGWYADAECENTPIVSDAVASQYETVYALFVPEEVLGVRAQLISHLEDTDATNDPTGTIRFVTSVDSEWYKEVGFNVSYDLNGDGIIQDGEKATRTSNKAYSKLLYIGGTDGQTMEYYPDQEFSSVSQYFKACTVKALSERYYDLDFTVEPFWRTPDGIIVTGEPQVKRINDGIAEKYEAKNDAKYYVNMEDAVNEASDNSTITVFRDAEVESAMTVNANITIQNRVGRDVTIYRGTGLATANTFDVGTTGTLTIKGADDKDSIVLDGRTKSEADANTGRDASAGSTGSLISNFGNLNIEDVTVQYVRKTAGTGGVINNNSDNTTNANAMVTIKNAVFDNNYSASYGSILYSRAKSTFTNVTFTNNKADNHGGVIYNDDGSLFEVEGSTFRNNAGKEGGVIWTDKAFTVKNSIFDDNTSTGIAGAIYTTEENAKGTIENCQFLNNESGNAGGAILNKGTDTLVSGCTFTDNTATTNGGAICSDEDMTIENTTFTSNEANGTHTSGDGTRGGGAFYTGKAVQITIKDCDFNSNAAAGGTNSCGGAICIKQGTLVMTDTNGSNFTSNTATHGGAIFLGGSSTATISDKSEFELNESVWAGGAIYSNGVLSVTDSTFDTNQSTSGAGGAVKLDTKATGTLTSCVFMNNKAKNGGAIHEQSTNTTTISACSFESNQATTGNGGAIAAQKGTDNVQDGCEFTSNTAASNGQAIYYENSGTLNLYDSIFNSYQDTDIYISAGTCNKDDIITQ